MNTDRKSEWLNKKNILVIVVGAIAMYAIATSLINTRFTEIEKMTVNQIAEQKSILVAVAEVTTRNGADSVTEKIIKDCSFKERSQFDDLLGRLNKGLTNSQLIELERLFGRCGAFYADRKAVMVSRLSREIQIYDNYVQQLEVITGSGNAKKDYLVDEWYELAAVETKISELFSELVRLQDEIIVSLLEGKLPDSEEVLEIAQQANQINETLSVTIQQASQTRSQVLSL
jgi:hypothetical protein